MLSPIHSPKSEDGYSYNDRMDISIIKGQFDGEDHDNRDNEASSEMTNAFKTESKQPECHLREKGVCISCQYNIYMKNKRAGSDDESETDEMEHTVKSLYLNKHMKIVHGKEKRFACSSFENQRCFVLL